MKHHHEGKLTTAIESQTEKVSSGVFLTVALAAMGASLALQCIRRKKTSLFVGQWVAPLLIMGVYNKLVKNQDRD